MVTKLGIGIATHGGMEAVTACSLIVAIQSIRVPVQMLLAMGCYIHINRQIIVKQAFDNDCSHLLFVDTDMAFGQDAIVRLMSHNLDIVGARYNKRVLPLESTVKQNITELSEVPFVPTGFLLINMEVLRTIGKPYFSFNDGAESEDVYFCDKAREAGYKVWCDPTIQVGHYGKVMY